MSEDTPKKHVHVFLEEWEAERFNGGVITIQASNDVTVYHISFGPVFARMGVAGVGGLLARGVVTPLRPQRKKVEPAH